MWDFAIAVCCGRAVTGAPEQMITNDPHGLCSLIADLRHPPAKTDEEGKN